MKERQEKGAKRRKKEKRTDETRKKMNKSYGQTDKLTKSMLNRHNS